LCPLAISFNNSNVDFDCVTRAELRVVTSQLGLIDNIGAVHGALAPGVGFRIGNGDYSGSNWPSGRATGVAARTNSYVTGLLLRNEAGIHAYIELIEK
tara:strand:- start:127 stop:420 length:294 start_codon:yes stop_codon:yes gene_type:complete